MPGPRDAMRWIGLGLGVAGLSGVLFARYTLGRSFSIRAKATELVTRGVYSRLRNPIYVFGIVFTVGFFLMVRKPYLWFVLPLFAGLQIIRARKEARVLEGNSAPPIARTANEPGSRIEAFQIIRSPV